MVYHDVCRIGDFSDEIEWQKFLSLACTALEKVCPVDHINYILPWTFKLTRLSKFNVPPKHEVQFYSLIMCHLAADSNYSYTFVYSAPL